MGQNALWGSGVLLKIPRRTEPAQRAVPITEGGPEHRGRSQRGGRSRGRSRAEGGPEQRVRRVGGPPFGSFSLFSSQISFFLLSWGSPRGIAAAVRGRGPPKVCVWASLHHFVGEMIHLRSGPAQEIFGL